MTSPAAQAVFAVASGALGLLFVLLGQRVWRAFLALSALFATGLLAFYLLLHNVAALPLWADAESLRQELLRAGPGQRPTGPPAQKQKQGGSVWALGFPLLRLINLQ